MEKLEFTQSPIGTWKSKDGRYVIEASYKQFIAFSDGLIVYTSPSYDAAKVYCGALARFKGYVDSAG